VRAPASKVNENDACVTVWNECRSADVKPARIVPANIRKKSSAAAMAAGSPDLRAMSRWTMASQAIFVDSFILAMTNRVCWRKASMAADFRPFFSALVLPLGAPGFAAGAGAAELILLFGKKRGGGSPPLLLPFPCLFREVASSASLRASRARGSIRATFAAALWRPCFRALRLPAGAPRRRGACDASADFVTGSVIGRIIRPIRPMGTNLEHQILSR
jgi:hypothetical protein